MSHINIHTNLPNSLTENEPFFSFTNFISSSFIILILVIGYLSISEKLSQAKTEIGFAKYQKLTTIYELKNPSINTKIKKGINCK